MAATDKSNLMPANSVIRCRRRCFFLSFSYIFICFVESSFGLIYFHFFNFYFFQHFVIVFTNCLLADYFRWKILEDEQEQALESTSQDKTEVSIYRINRVYMEKCDGKCR